MIISQLLFFATLSKYEVRKQLLQIIEKRYQHFYFIISEKKN